jgi:hypothetical protein
MSSTDDNPLTWMRQQRKKNKSIYQRMGDLG